MEKYCKELLFKYFTLITVRKKNSKMIEVIEFLFYSAISSGPNVKAFFIINMAVVNKKS